MAGARKLLFSVFPLALLALTCELAFGFLGMPEAPVGQHFEHNEIYWVADSELKVAPFAHREVGGAFDVSTNADGLRASSHAREKPDDVYRVLILGCSTTFGWGVGDDETYPAVTQRIFEERGVKNVEVINGGQPGYTSFQGLWFYENVGRMYDADLVLFGFVVQDARRAAYSDRSQALLQADARFLKQKLLYRLRSYRMLKQWIDKRRIAKKERPEEGDQGVYRVPPEDYVANIRAMKDMVDADGGNLFLFGFPLERAGYTELHRRILAAAAEELEVPILDAQENMDVESRERTLFFPQDRGHANAEGHALIGEWLATHLQTRGFVKASTP